MVNAKKIAEIAEVSRSTVQRALSNKSDISPRTKEKVLRIARSLGYKPNRAAKTLVMRQQKLEYGVIFSITENKQFYQDILKGIEKARDEIKEFGVHIDVRFMDSIDGVAQAHLIDRLVKEKKRGLALVAINSTEVRDAVNRGVKQGTDFVTIVSDIERSRRLCFVGQDLVKSGEVAGGLMNYLVQRGEKIACFVGSEKYLAHQQRLNGFRKRFLEYHEPGDILTVVENEDSATKSEELTERLLTKHPEVKGIFIAGAGAIGVLKVIERRKLRGKIKMVTYDLVQSREYCKRGYIDFVIDQDPVQEGYKALNLLNNYIMFDEVPDERVYTRIDIRTRDNCDM